MYRILLLAITLTASFAIRADVLLIAAEDDAAPWSKKDGSGYANDIVRAAFAAAGQQIKLDILPYARCKHAVILGERVACLSMSWSPELEGAVTFSAQPLFICNADYFYNTRKPLIAQDEKSLPHNAVIGTVLGYEYPPALVELTKRGIRLEATASEEANLKKLALGRLDLALVNHNDVKSVQQMLMRAGVKNSVALAFGSGQLKSYIGFSRHHPQGEQVRVLFDQGYKRITENGELKKINKKWSGQ